MAETIRIEIPIETIDETQAGVQSAIQGLKKLESAVSNMQKAYRESEKQVSKFDKTAEKTQSRLSKWAKEKYQVLLEAKEKITPLLQKLGGGLRNLTGKAWSITLKALDMASAPIRGILNLLRNPLLQAGAVLGVSFGVADSVNTFKGFESAMSQVSAISGATGVELEKLTAKAQEMGKTTKFTATEAAEAFNYMAMAGWKTSDMLGGIEGILSLAAASGQDLATTSDIVTDALTAFNLEAKDASRFADVLAAASSNSNTNVSMMGETFKYAATMAGTLGYSIEDVAVAVGLMANRGLKASMAGTALNMIMTRLSTNTDGARDAIKELGVEFFNSDGSARDFSIVMEELRAATQNMTDAQKTEFANTVAGTQAQKGLLAILNATTKEYDSLTKAINNSEGAASEMAETMMDNLQGSLTLLQSAVDGVKTTFGGRLAPYIREFANMLTDQMPNIEKWINNFFDKIDAKAAELKNKIRDLTGSADWKNADFFGKIKIAWDKIIAEPFSEWWEQGGKKMIAEKAAEVGQFIGTGLSTGLLAILGIDIAGAANEGASIGASFAKGFAEGFDLSAVGEGLKEALGNLFKSAGKLLPGGESADLGSLLSAAILAKIASPLVSLGKGAFNIGEGIFSAGKMASPVLGKMLGSYSMQAELAGTGLAGGTGIAGFLGNIGASAGATTAAGAVGLGTAAVGGVVAGGVSVVSGIKDLRIALDRNSDEMKRQAYGASAAMTFGGIGVGAAGGAAVGAALGSAVPVVGTLIGAGIGGIAGMIGGHFQKKKYEEEMARLQQEEEERALRIQKIYAATGDTVDNMRFKEKYLNDALMDTNISVNEFAALMQEAVGERAQEAFGNISLSMAEISELAEDIAIDEDTLKDMEDFQKQSKKTKENFEKLKDLLTDIEKMEWKAKLDMGMSREDWQQYKGEVDQFMEELRDYVENKHYEATLAVDLLLGGKGANIQNVFNGVYQGLENELNDIQIKLGTEFELEEPDPAKIAELMQQAQDIMDKISNAQTEASMDTLLIKYTGAELDVASFEQLQVELSAKVEELAAGYDDALEVSLSALNLSLSEGAIDETTYESMRKELEDGYNEHIRELNLRVESFNLEAIATAWSTQLDGILPDIEGTTQEKLSQAMRNALANKSDVSAWTQDDVARWFGLDELRSTDPSAFTNIFKELLISAASVPEGTKEEMAEKVKSEIPTKDEILNSINWDEFTVGDAKILDKILGFDSGEAIAADEGDSTKWADLYGPQLDTMAEALSTRAITALENGMDAEAISEFMTTFMSGALPSSIEIPDEATAGVTEALGNSLKAAVDGMDLTATNEAITTTVQNNVMTAVEAVNLDEAAAKIPTRLGTGIANNAGLAQDGINTLHTSVQTQLNTSFAPGFDVNVPVRLHYTYSESGGGGAVGMGGFAPPSRASGGLVSGKQLSWIGEDGPEAIIPLSSSRRSRALDLYEEVGNMLGIGQHALGGIVGNASEVVPEDDRSMVMPADSHSSGSTPLIRTEQSAPNISINVNMSAPITVSADRADSSGSDEIVSRLQDQMDDVVDLISQEIASRLQVVYGNMPAVSGV